MDSFPLGIVTGRVVSKVKMEWGKGKGKGKGKRDANMWLSLLLETCKSTASAATNRAFAAPASVLVSSNEQFDFFCDV